jgi:hypothetical protein
MPSWNERGMPTSLRGLPKFTFGSASGAGIAPS